ncbi:MAG: methyltransferase domain-containing protein [Nanoarchaeota archaeon]
MKTDLKEYSAHSHNVEQPVLCTHFDKCAWLCDLLSRLSSRPKQYYKAIKALAKPKARDIVLDIGGGTGSIAQYFIPDVRKVVVLDPSQKMLNRIRAKRLEAIVGTAQHLEFDDKTFDLIYCVDSFHHFTNGYAPEEYRKTIHQSIQEILRVLKNDGTLIVIEFNRLHLGGKLIDFMENKLAHMGSVFYSPKEFMNLFSEYGTAITIKNFNPYTYLAKIIKGSVE